MSDPALPVRRLRNDAAGRGQDLQSDRGDSQRWQRPPVPEHLLEALSRDQLHDDPWPAVLFDDIELRHDARVPQPRRRPRFPHRPAPQHVLSRVVETGRQAHRLDRHHLVQQLVPRPPDRAHAAASQRLQQVVAPGQQGPRARRRRRRHRHGRTHRQSSGTDDPQKAGVGGQVSVGPSAAAGRVDAWRRRRPRDYAECLESNSFFCAPEADARVCLAPATCGGCWVPRLIGVACPCRTRGSSSPPMRGSPATSI